VFSRSPAKQDGYSDLFVHMFYIPSIETCW
jgi:hypothetical protein